ncbi:MAG TPA: hypothetical protein VEI52_15660 [Terriglobales bacterium]|nr:hypothetical protein [Terriglobales bacterium]
MRKKKVGAIAIKSFVLLVVLGTAYQAMAQDATTPYPNMASIEQYLRTELPRSRWRAAQHRSPFHAMQRSWFLDVMVSKTAVKEKNGFVCIVGRSWTSAPDPDFWNAKVRVPMCFNAGAARSYLLRYIKTTDLILAGRTKAQVDEAITAAIDKKELPAMEPGAMCFMMSKQGYAGDTGEH